MKIPFATFLLAISFIVSQEATAQACRIERATVSSTGQPANGDSADPTLSFDGRFVAFGSSATTLVPGDVNGWTDSFVFDRMTATVQMISVATSGAQGDGRSVGPKLSADGRMVAFGSEATNLDLRDKDAVRDVYVHDRVTRTTTLVSERLGTGPSLQGGYGVSISADGRYVAFDCLDDNVLPGDTNGKSDVFVRDLVTQTTERVSVGPAGQQGDEHSRQPSISGDGRFVAFVSAARNWFTHTYNYSSGVFVRDRRFGVTLPVTVLPDGRLAPGVVNSPCVSADGRYVAFTGNSAVLVPSQPYQYETVMRWDRLTGQIVNVCFSTTGGAPDYPSYFPELSANGRYVAFETLARNLTVQPGKTPMVIWTDMETGATVVVNETPDGSPANDWANKAAISGDGRAVAFVSKATNLLPPETGWTYHVYVRACDVASPSTFCKPATPPGGCVGRMTFQGTPSASAGSGLDVRAEGVDAGKVGLLFYGEGGPWGQAVSQGLLCVQGPIVRAQVSGSGGTAGCDGVLAMDFNAWIASGVDPGLVAGQSAYVQAWFRSGPGTSQLSDALALLIEP